MADDNKIILNIVLDDGSVISGFAKIKQEAKKTTDDVGGQFKTLGDIFDADVIGIIKNKIREIPVSFAAVGVAAIAAGALIKSAFDLTLEGERIKSVETQFRNLAAASGVSGEQLAEGLAKSANGLITTDDLLKTATKSVIELGRSAERLPDVLEVTRKATLALGGSLQERFEAVVQAISSGQTRMLRSQGIIIDQEKAFKKYADTLGVTAGSLDKAQQQQAILNAFLAQAGEKFKDVQQGLNQNNVAVKQASVAVKELYENFALFINSKLGDTFAQITSGVAGLFKALAQKETAGGLTSKIDEVKSLNEQISLTQKFIEANKKEIADLGVVSGALFGDSFKENLKESEASLDVLKLRLEEVNKGAQRRPDAEKGSAPPPTEDPLNKLNEQQIREAQQRNDFINQLNNQALQDNISFRQALIDSNLGSKEAENIQAEVDIDNEIALEEQKGLAINAIREKFHGDSIVATKARADAELAINADFAAKKQTLDLTVAQREKHLQQAKLGGLSTFFGGLASLTASSNQQLFEIGKVGAISKATVDGYLAIQSALAEVPYPFNIAAAAGIGIATAANVASIIGTNFGGGGTVSGASAAVTSASGIGESALTNLPDTERTRNTQPSINVNLTGANILGDEGAGRRIVELVNAAFDTSGVQVRTGITA